MRKSIERTVKVSREGILVAHADSKASLLSEEEKKNGRYVVSTHLQIIAIRERVK